MLNTSCCTSIGISRTRLLMVGLNGLIDRRGDKERSRDVFIRNGCGGGLIGCPLLLVSGSGLKGISTIGLGDRRGVNSAWNGERNMPLLTGHGVFFFDIFNSSIVVDGQTTSHFWPSEVNDFTDSIYRSVQFADILLFFFSSLLVWVSKINHFFVYIRYIWNTHTRKKNIAKNEKRNEIVVSARAHSQHKRLSICWDVKTVWRSKANCFHSHKIRESNRRRWFLSHSTMPNSRIKFRSRNLPMLKIAIRMWCLWFSLARSLVRLLTAS